MPREKGKGFIYRKFGEYFLKGGTFKIQAKVATDWDSWKLDLGIFPSALTPAAQISL